MVLSRVKASMAFCKRSSFSGSILAVPTGAFTLDDMAGFIKSGVEIKDHIEDGNVEFL